MKTYAFRHPSGGYLNKEGGDPCYLCPETLLSYDPDLYDSPEEVEEKEIKND